METYNFAIKEGDTGDAVIIVQEQLKILGYYDVTITGSFDAYTKEAVMKFQKSASLFPTGVVDLETAQMLQVATTNPVMPLDLGETRPVLRLGDTGIYVVELQTVLTNLLYYRGLIDGNFGQDTLNAVKVFQINNKITPDGIVGRDTWSALSTLYSPLAICDDNGGEDKYITYIVVAGDTLWKIAKRFNTTVDTIKRLNNLTSDMLSIGQKLLIPSSAGESNPPTTTYIVVAGDTLWKIAQRFNTTVDAIKRLNNLTSDMLSIGQKLLIPSSAGESNPPTTTYIVVAGDTLWKIAQRFNTTVDAIKRLNNLTSDNLRIGQQLLISR